MLAGSIQDKDEDLSDDVFDELEETEYSETEALKLITKGDITVNRWWLSYIVFYS